MQSECREKQVCFSQLKLQFQGFQQGERLVYNNLLQLKTSGILTTIIPIAENVTLLILSFFTKMPSLPMEQLEK